LLLTLKSKREREREREREKEISNLFIEILAVKTRPSSLLFAVVLSVIPRVV
jgi:hypothetical protein